MNEYERSLYNILRKSVKVFRNSVMYFLSLFARIISYKYAHFSILIM